MIKTLNRIYTNIMPKLGSFLFVYFLIFTLSFSLLEYFKLTPSYFSEINFNNLDYLLALGLAAGILQVFGYVLYIRDVNIDPNPVTWFMFAYGTGILTILEWDQNATTAELILPAACALMSILVSYRCWVRARSKDPSHWWPRDWWPEDRAEKVSFIMDIAITISYVGAWALASWSILSLDNKEIAVMIFLILSNISTFPSFFPLLKETYLHPERERSAPWLVWTASYSILAIVTLFSHEGINWLLLFYPLSSIVLHALMAWLASPSRRNINHIHN
jgi:hypothetical protein